MRAPAIPLLAFVLACASLPPVKYVDTQRREAMVHADIATLRELFADGLRYGHANGQVNSKEELLSLLGSGALDYRSIGVDSLQIREIAGAWVLTGRQTVEVTQGGRDITSVSVFTAVYAKQDGRLRLIAYQSTPAPQ